MKHYVTRAANGHRQKDKAAEGEVQETKDLIKDFAGFRGLPSSRRIKVSDCPFLR